MHTTNSKAAHEARSGEFAQTDAVESARIQSNPPQDGVTSGTVPEVTSAETQPKPTAPSSAAPKAATGAKTKVAEKKKQGFVPSVEACANVWQRSKVPHFSPGFTVRWKGKEYILTKFNYDEHGSITLLDQRTGKSQTVTPINAKGQIVGLSLVSAEVRTQNKALIKAFAQTKISKCTLEPAQIVSEMQDKVFAPVKQIATQIIAAQQKMQGRIKEILIANADLIHWARDEFGAQGRKVPVPGTPSYNEWLKENLTIEMPDGTKELACTDRYVRKVMAALDKQLAEILREKLELPPVPKPPKRKKEQDREEHDSPFVIGRVKRTKTPTTCWPRSGKRQRTAARIPRSAR